MFLQRLGSRVGELMALLAGVLALLFRIPSCRHPRLHIGMDIVTMGEKVVDDPVLNRPGKEVQLSDGGGDPAEVQALPPTEGVEHLLAVRLEVGLVGEVDDHVLSSLGDVGYIVHLGIVRDKPV